MPNYSRGRVSAQKLHELVSLIFATHRAIRDSVESGESIDPFTVLRLEALRFVDVAESPTMKDIAGNLRITAPSVTQLVQSLAKAGYVKRRESSVDRRVTHLSITPKGKRFLAEGFAAVERSMKTTFSRLSERDIDEVIKTLKRLSLVYGKA